MSSPSDDDADSELSKYAPKWYREQPQRLMPNDCDPSALRVVHGEPSESAVNAETCPGAAGTAGGWVTGAGRPDSSSGGSGCGSRIVSCLCETTIGRHKLSQFGFAE